MIKLFANDIAIDVAPDRFTFTCRDTAITLETLVLVARGSGGFQVLAVGETPPDAPSSDVVRVDLFSSSGLPPGVPDRFEFLTAFMRHAFMTVTGRVAMVRPAVTIQGVHSLSQIAHGYEQSLIARAAIDAGARTVEFK